MKLHCLPIMNIASGFTPGYCPEYQTVYDDFTTKPESDLAAAQDTLISGIKSDGDLSSIAGMWVMNAHTDDNGEARTNWMNPTGDKALAILSPTFTQYKGFKGNGTSNYLNLQWNASDDGGGITSLNGLSVMVLVRTAGNDGAKRLMGARDYPLNVSSLIYNDGRVMLNSEFNTTGDSSFTTGYLSAIRSASNLITRYIDTDAGTGEAINSLHEVPRDFYVLADNVNGSPDNYSDAEVSLVIIGNFNDTAKNRIIARYNTYLSFFF